MNNRDTNKYSKISLIIIFKEKMTKFIYEIRNKLVYERCEVIL